MHVFWNVPPAIEEQLRQFWDKGDHESIRRLVAEHLTPPVEAQLAIKPLPPLTDEEFEAILDQMEAIVDSADAPPLSDYALTREGIYGDHP